MRKENINLYSHVRTCYPGEVKSYDEVIFPNPDTNQSQTSSMNYHYCILNKIWKYPLDKTIFLFVFPWKMVSSLHSKYSKIIYCMDRWADKSVDA